MAWPPKAQTFLEHPLLLGFVVVRRLTLHRWSQSSGLRSQDPAPGVVHP